MADFPQDQPRYRQFANRFAHSLLERDYLSLRNQLAPWLQDKYSPVELQAFFEQEIHEVAEMLEDPSAFPDAYELGTGVMRLEDFIARSANYALASLGSLEGITEENYRHWLKIALLADEERGLDVDGFYDLWFILIEHQGQLCAAYFEVHDLD